MKLRKCYVSAATPAMPSAYSAPFPLVSDGEALRARLTRSTDFPGVDLSLARCCFSQ